MTSAHYLGTFSDANQSESIGYAINARGGVTIPSKLSVHVHLLEWLGRVEMDVT